jgi:GBP family porin
MKKTLLAAALLAGFAGAASAQSSVTLYGIVDVGVRYQNWNYTNAKGKDLGTNSLAMVGGQESTSRIGFKGVETLSGGNVAAFVVELGSLDPANGTLNTTALRQSTIGLSNASWGNFEMGRQLGLASKYAGSIDPFLSNFPIANASNSFGLTTVRYSNMLMYRTPTMSGFQAGVSYSFNTGLASFDRSPTTGLPVATTTNAGGNAFSSMNNQRAVSLGATYTNGPVFVFGNYDKIMAANGTSTASQNTSGWIVGGTYDAKVVKVAASYGQVRDGYINGQTAIGGTVNGFDNPNSNGGVVFAEGSGTKSFMLGLTAPIASDQKVFASYQNMSATGFSTYQKFNTLGTQSIFAVGYQYAFTKRTDAFAYYAYTNNYQNIAGLSGNTLGVGLRHQF